MQITINQVEIEAAIKAHILNQINVKEGHKLAIEMKAGRGADGYTATIDISPEENKPAAAPQPTEPKQATAPKAEVAEQKQEPQKAPEPVAEVVQQEVVQQKAEPTQAEPEKMSLFGDLPKVSDTNK